jgi:hypothetical protein
MVPIELEASGCYRVPGTEFSIIRTEHSGPKGGKCGLWEIIYMTSLGSTIFDDVTPGTTLREAREHLAAFLAKP